MGAIAVVLILVLVIAIIVKGRKTKSSSDAATNAERTNKDIRRNPADKEGIGWEFYLYTGGNTRHTSPFCKEKNGRFFHYKEIMDWAKEDWEGKHPDTTEASIFHLVGGYCNKGDFVENCSHSLMPVSAAVVPHNVLKRNMAKGYYAPPSFMLDQLN